MRSLQQYREIYREIAQSLGYRGDSAELLIQLLANATYIEEVETINYALESSLSSASLMNSKIKQSMDFMYSVYRGNCPRVILCFRPTKYMELSMFDEIATSSNFKVYYLGYYETAGTSTESSDSKDPLAYDEGVVYASKSFLPITDSNADPIIILGFISPTKYDTDTTWTVSATNQYYVENSNLSNLSNDVKIEIRKQGESGNNRLEIPTTEFATHILDKKIFDLTTPDFGSRLYFNGSLEPSDQIVATYFAMSRLSDYSENELKKITIRGAAMENFDHDFLEARNDASNSILSEIAPGLVLIDGPDREDSISVHYNANKNRYINTIFRSNTDIGELLKMMYPEDVAETVCVYSDQATKIYYVPVEGKSYLSTAKKRNFIDSRKAYYIANEITIDAGVKKKLIINVDLELYSEAEKIQDKIDDIVSPYRYSFDAAKKIEKMIENPERSVLKKELMSALSKLPNVRYVKNIDLIAPDKDSSDDTIPSYYEITTSHNITIS